MLSGSLLILKICLIFQLLYDATPIDLVNFLKFFKFNFDFNDLKIVKNFPEIFQKRWIYE